MAYLKSYNKNLRSLDSFGLSHRQGGENSPIQMEFYELELGVVLDVIIDDNHAFFKGGSNTFKFIDADRWPVSVYDKSAANTDIDYSWIGRSLVRPIISGKNVDKDKLVWAYPLEANISEYPLINETVVLSSYNGKVFYSRKLNYHNWTNNNLDFKIDESNPSNTELFSTSPYSGTKVSVTNSKGNTGFRGFAGKYFVANNRIRNLKRYEGDLAIESRFGQSIHFTSYDDNRMNDVGTSTGDYANNGGNPMILIRNRQRPILEIGSKLTLHNSPNLAEVIGTTQEKNVGGYISENINHDGSSIHITSGKTESQFQTTCYKQMFGMGEEVPAFDGTTNFQYPVLNGDQIIINSDRLLFSSRYGESLHFSKKRYGIVTDSEFVVDAHDQIVLTTHVKTVINSTAIYLGEYDQTGEPALLGQTTVNWLYEMCNWLLEHTHFHKHSHPRTGEESPHNTQFPVEQQQLISLRDSLKSLMSRRVFLTGGGFSPGQNGNLNSKVSVVPTKINIMNGEGTPGGFGGESFRPPN